MLLASTVAAFALTAILRRYALRYRWLDVPNARSSHARPTPRGGGVAIVSVFVAGLTGLALAGVVSMSVLVALSGAGLLVALVGWLDDRGHVPAGWRLLAHFLAAAWGLAWLGGLPPLVLFGTPVEPGWPGQLLVLLYLVWLLNLYNFMDGIDGIAGIEALAVGAGAALLLGWLAGNGHWLAPALLAAASLGFLLWNFPRAHIFMGDSGSGFLGLMLGLLSIQAARVAPEYFWMWLVLLGVFAVDATLTLLRRLLRGERIYQAHRSHAYQHAARMLGAHLPVALGAGLLTLLWLLPVAALVALGHLDGALAVLIAYAPLAAGAWWLGAGRPDAHP